MLKKMIYSSVILLLVLPGFNFAGETDEADWVSFEDGIKEATTLNKPVLIDFYAQWCHWCKVMDEKTFSNNTVARYLREHFITIKLDAENKGNSINFKGQKYNSAELTRAFKVTGFPSLAFLDKNQEPVGVIPGFIKPETFMHLLKFIKEECYKKKITLDEYIKNGCNKT